MGPARERAVPPGKSYTYTWVADETAGPGPADPSSIVWLYHSHVMEEEEANLGLIGTIVITRQRYGAFRLRPRAARRGSGIHHPVHDFQ